MASVSASFLTMGPYSSSQTLPLACPPGSILISLPVLPSIASSQGPQPFTLLRLTGVRYRLVQNSEQDPHPIKAPLPLQQVAAHNQTCFLGIWS